VRLSLILFCALINFVPALAQTNLPPRAIPVSPEDMANPQLGGPATVPGGVDVHWFGHGFVFLTSSVGVRAAIDPFGPDTVHYKFPDHLTADFVLVSHESEDHAAAEQLFGNPLIFRSVTAIGLNRANGIPFRGIALQKDANGNGPANTAFTIVFDGIKFCYLGQVAQPLLANEIEQIGKVDVLFLPVGLPALSVSDWNQVAADLKAQVIIPINYKTEYSGYLELRPLEEYLSQTKLPIQHIDSSEMVVSKSLFPPTPTVYVLKSP